MKNLDVDESLDNERAEHFRNRRDNAIEWAKLCTQSLPLAERNDDYEEENV